MSADMRAVTAQSDRIGRYFARQNNVSSNDFRALLHVLVAEAAGTPLTMAQLRQRMDVSPAAITYLVDRMINAGHVRREADPADRRRVNDGSRTFGARPAARSKMALATTSQARREPDLAKRELSRVRSSATCRRPTPPATPAGPPPAATDRASRAPALRGTRSQPGRRGARGPAWFCRPHRACARARRGLYAGNRLAR